MHEVPLLDEVPASELLRHLGKRVDMDAIPVRNSDRTHGETRHGLVSGEPELAHAVVEPPLAPVPPFILDGLEGIRVQRPAASLEANRAKQGWLLIGGQRRLREGLGKTAKVDADEPMRIVRTAYSKIAMRENADGWRSATSNSKYFSTSCTNSEAGKHNPASNCAVKTTMCPGGGEPKVDPGRGSTAP